MPILRVGLRCVFGREAAAISGRTAHARRGPPDRGQYCEAAGAAETAAVLSRRLDRTGLLAVAAAAAIGDCRLRGNDGQDGGGASDDGEHKREVRRQFLHGRPLRLVGWVRIAPLLCSANQCARPQMSACVKRFGSVSIGMIFRNSTMAPGQPGVGALPCSWINWETVIVPRGARH